MITVGKLIFFIFVLRSGPTLTQVCNTIRFTAVTCTNFSQVLRQLIGNEDIPSGTEDPRIRQRICEDISYSGFVRQLNMVPIDIADVQDGQSDHRCADVFEDTYTATDLDERLYVNPYKLKSFTTVFPFESFKEQVFVCTLKDQLRDQIHPYYVSKEYNISSSKRQFRPGRFVFGSLLSGTSWPFADILLAEQPVKAHTDSDFNVEMHYLRIRKFVPLSQGPDIDPLCKMFSGDSKDQLFRICATISASPDFANEFQNPRRPSSHCHCHSAQIFFKTDEGFEASDGKPYYERVAQCKFTTVLDPGPLGATVYVSRAYMSNQIFIYRRDPLNRKMYLVNLSIDAGIVDEINSFDFIEE